MFECELLKLTFTPIEIFGADEAHFEPILDYWCFLDDNVL